MFYWASLRLHKKTLHKGKEKRHEKFQILLVVLALTSVLFTACDKTDNADVPQNGTEQSDPSDPRPDAPQSGTEQNIPSGPSETHAHDYDGSWKVYTEPICTAVGLRKGTCSCGNETVEEIPAKGHVEVRDAAKAPTCVEDGWTAGSHCSECDAILFHLTKNFLAAFHALNM